MSTAKISGVGARILKSRIIMIAAVMLMLLTGSCRKAPINGKLDAQWQVTSIEFADGSPSIGKSRLYFNFYLHVVQLTGASGITGNMVYSDNKIAMDFPNNVTEDKLKQLTRYGIMRNPVVFEVLKLDGSTLVMKSDETTITCRRF